MPKKSHRARYRDNNKKGAKDPICYERKLEKEISHRQAKLAEIRSAKKTPGKRRAAPRVTTPQTVEQTELQATLKPNTAEKRVTIKVLYYACGCPPEEDWDGRRGTIALIRQRMAAAAPWPESVRRGIHGGGGADIMCVGEG